MQIIAHKKMLFHRSEVITHPKSGENHHLIHESVVVEPSKDPQEVPDWITEDGLFALAVSDRSLIPCAILPEHMPVSQKQPTPTKTGLPTGWAKK